jgi:hypothetical protein
METTTAVAETAAETPVAVPALTFKEQRTIYAYAGESCVAKLTEGSEGVSLTVARSGGGKFDRSLTGDDLVAISQVEQALRSRPGLIESLVGELSGGELRQVFGLVGKYATAIQSATDTVLSE